MERVDRDLIRWWDALDSLAGRRVPLDVEQGMRLARKCRRHPDALWLCSLFPGDAPVSRKAMLRALPVDSADARVMFLRSQICSSPALLKQAALLDYPPAQVKWSAKCEGTSERIKWAEKAAESRDRHALWWLGSCYWNGEGDRTIALALFEEAATLGDAAAQHIFALKRPQMEIGLRYMWWGRAAARGHIGASNLIVSGIVSLMKSFEHSSGSGRALFEVGSALQGRRSAKQTGFGCSAGWHAPSVEKRCVELYELWCGAARAAIECWLGVARRFGVVRDVRQLVARRLWEDRRLWINEHGPDLLKRVGWRCVCGCPDVAE